MTAKKMLKFFAEGFFTRYKFKGILCLNGKLSKTILLTINQIKTLPIIATDGAYKKLKKFGFLPDIIIGDLDSCENIEDKNLTKVIFDPCQETSDFQKAITYAKNQQIYPLIIMGLNGGQLDHIIGNLNVFSQLKDCIFVDYPNCFGIVMSPNEVEAFNVPVNTRISIFPIISSRVKTEGLNWNLDNIDLEFGKAFSLSNFNINQKIKFQVMDGKILVIFTLK